MRLQLLVTGGVLTACLAADVKGQVIGTTGIERETGRDAWWRLAYDNDFFTATDRYFTQGIALEVVTPSLRRVPVARALLAPRGSVMRYGIVYEDDGYTASDLKASQILRNDHPYAGTKQLRMFAIASDPARHRRITSSLNVGIIGQGAGGKQIQTFIHERTGNTIPQGWGNQIRNDLILNYEATMEAPVLQRGSQILLAGLGAARFGTYNTAATLGMTLMLGRIANPFNTAPIRARSVFVYAKPQLNIVAYDATLQGGLFNRTSPYVISARDLSRLVYRQRVGVVYRSGRRSLEYYQSVDTREFRGGRAHRSGGFQFTMPLGR